MSEFFICTKCKGVGTLTKEYCNEDVGRQTYTGRCGMCGGRGYLDWVEYAMGNSKRRFFSISVSPKPISHKRVMEIRRELLKS